MNNRLTALLTAALATSAGHAAEITVIPPSAAENIDQGVELIEQEQAQPAADAAQLDLPTQPDQAMLVLDASGSMWGEIDGRTKINIARSVVTEVIEDWGTDTHLGLIAYGHRQKGACSDIETLLQPASVDSENFVNLVNSLNPKGKTPLTQAVIKAAETLKYTETKATVILVSDGKETCRVDPCAAGKRLEQLGVDFTAHVISFDVPEEDTAGLKCLAETTGGRYLNARDADELKTALSEAAVVTKTTTPPAPIAVETASVRAPREVIAGSTVVVDWTGPKARFDRIAIFTLDGREELTKTYIHERQDVSPSDLLVPEAPGDYLLQYYHRPEKANLASTPIRILPASATVAVPASVMASSEFPVTWTGPKNLRDTVAVFTADGRDRLNYKQLHRREVKSPTDLVAPDEPGTYLVRYHTREKNTWAETTLQVTPAVATIKAPATAIPEEKFEVFWTGPGNRGDRIQLIDLATGKPVITRTVHRKRSPMRLKAPEREGNYQLRYFSIGIRELATSPLSVRKYVPPTGQ